MGRVTAYKFRIYPDSKRQTQIDRLLLLSQQFYNKLLELAINSYKNDKQPISMSKLNRFANSVIKENKEYLQLYSQTRCEIKYRLLKAYRNFFRRVKNGDKKKGFPRFKSRDRYRSITYPQDNGSFSIEKDRLRISRIGTMHIKIHRKIEGTIKTMSIKRQAGEYYAIFTAIREIETPKLDDTNPVGMDMGLMHFIALSDGTTIEKPQFMRKNHRKIAHWQKVVAGRVKGSKRRQKAKEKLERAYAVADMQNEDFLHKLTKTLVDDIGYTSFAVENLSIKNMERNHRLARSINNASWGKFQNMLLYKAGRAGIEVIEIDPRFTTQKCSGCGHVKEGEERQKLNDRIYNCTVCGLTIDRDINAAINIKNGTMLKRATAGHAGSNARGDMVATMQQALQTASLNREHTMGFEATDPKGSLGF